jgi:SAM-dependent methyltransferase
MVLNSLHWPFVRPGKDDPFHVVFNEFIVSSRQNAAPVILEIGSRNVTGITRRGWFPHAHEYVGFDILPGAGVDVVGDVHQLSSILPPEHFDFVFSISVFEHLLFPWKAVLEINRVMKSGGLLHVSTHPAWPPHECPWDFWRFPSNGFHALFNKFTGFEIVTLTEGLPARLYSLVDDAPTRGNYLYPVNQGVALIARKTGNYRSDLLKWDIDIADVVSTMYPAGPDKTVAR